MPSINDLKQEFLTQNTANYIVKNNIAQTDLDVNPDRYILMNGHNAETDPLMKTGSLYEKDPNAYYPFVNPPQMGTASMPVTPPEAISRYGNSNIYPLDQKPYYAPNGGEFRVIVDMPKDKLNVPINLGDLSLTHADDKNVRKLEAKLQDLTRPESLNSVSMTGKYIPDAKAYYDPTAEEKTMNKIGLENTIVNMKADLLNPNMPKFQFDTITSTPKVQNYQNKNKEETNEMIANSYHYPIVKDGQGHDLAGHVGNKDKVLIEAQGFVLPEGQIKTYGELVKDGSVLGVKYAENRLPTKVVPEGVTIGPSKRMATVNTNVFTKDDKYVEAEENSKTYAEADDVGTTLGSKYVNEKNESVKKNAMVEADSVDKKTTEAEDVKNPSANPDARHKPENKNTNKNTKVNEVKKNNLMKKTEVTIPKATPKARVNEIKKDEKEVATTTTTVKADEKKKDEKVVTPTTTTTLVKAAEKKKDEKVAAPTTTPVKAAEKKKDEKVVVAGEKKIKKDEKKAKKEKSTTPTPNLKITAKRTDSTTDVSAPIKKTKKQDDGMNTTGGTMGLNMNVNSFPGSTNTSEKEIDMATAATNYSTPSTNLNTIPADLNGLTNGTENGATENPESIMSPKIVLDNGLPTITNVNSIIPESTVPIVDTIGTVTAPTTAPTTTAPTTTVPTTATAPNTTAPTTTATAPNTIVPTTATAPTTTAPTTTASTTASTTGTKTAKKNSKINLRTDSAEDNVENKSTSPKALNTQGLKIERVKILPMRKIMNINKEQESEEDSNDEDSKEENRSESEVESEDTEKVKAAAPKKSNKNEKVNTATSKKSTKGEKKVTKNEKVTEKSGKQHRDEEEFDEEN
jgi:hypothetical protein